MSLFDEYLAGRSGSASAGARAASMEADASIKSDAMNAAPSSLFDEFVKGREATPVSARPSAIPNSTNDNYSAGEFAGDVAKMGASTLVGGTLKAPLGVESAGKKAIRDTVSGELMDAHPGMRLFNMARMALVDALGIRSIGDQVQDKEKAKIAVDKALSGVHLPGVQGLAEYGDQVQRDIQSSISATGKQRLADSTPQGNIFKGEFSLGDDPTLAGYALQVAGVLGSLAPVVATALVTKNPNAAAAVGGSMAAGEGYDNAKEYISKQTHEHLMESSPYYKAMIDRGVPQAQAKEIITEKAGESAAVLQGIVAAVGDRVTGRLLTGAYDDILRKVGGKGLGGRIAAGAVGAGIEEGAQEVGEGLASDIGIHSQVKSKEIGEDSAANLVLGALGGSHAGAFRGAMSKPTNEQLLADALNKDIKNTTFSQGQTDEAARMALDPERATLGAENVITPGASSTVAATAENSARNSLPAGGEQQGTAVTGGINTATEQTEPNQAQLMSLGNSGNSGQTAGSVNQSELESMLGAVDAQNQQLKTAVEQPETLTTALKGIATDLQLQPDETLNVTEVTTDKRLNKFAEALSQAFGVNVHWVDFGEGGMTTSSGRNLGQFNGYRLGDTVLISPNQDFMDTTWHELTHTLETKHPEVYAQLRDTILRTVDPQMKQRLYDALNQRRRAEIGQDMAASELESELVAVVTGQHAANPEMLKQLFDGFQDKNLAQQFKDVLMEIFDKLAAALRGPQYIKDRQRVTQAREAIQKAFAEYQKREAAKNTQAAQPGGVSGVGTGVAQSSQPAPTMPAALAEKVAASKGSKQGGAFSREGLIFGLAEGKNVSVTDLIGHADIYTVYQNTQTLIRRAPAIKSRYDNRMNRLAGREGMRLMAGPVKKFPRAFSKIWFDYAGDHTKIGDIVRSTLVVADLHELDEMIRAVQDFFPGVAVKRNGWDLTAPVHPSGYRDVFFKGAVIDGFPVELQMNFAQMLKAKDVAHKLYEKEEKLRRSIISKEKPMSPGDISAAQDEMRELQMEQFEIYSEASQLVFDRANMVRQSDSDMGTPSDVQVEAPKVRGAVSPVRGLSSQAESAPSGERVTGTPLTSKNVVPSGNEPGMGISVSPQAIPNSNVPQQQVQAQASRKVRFEDVEKSTKLEQQSNAGTPRSTSSLMQMQPEAARESLGLNATPSKKTPNNVRQIGEALNARTVAQHGVIDGKDTSEEAMSKLAQAMADEVQYALGGNAKTGSGLGWYSVNYPNAVKKLARVFPEIADSKAARDIFTAIVAITSNGERVSANISNAIKIYSDYRMGKPLVAVGTRRATALDNNLAALDMLVTRLGYEGAVEHLMGEMTVKEINAELRARGAKASSAYTADMTLPRAALYFGPKLGAFYANLMGAEGYLTMDLWWSRTVNRMRGILLPQPTESSMQRLAEMMGMNQDAEEEQVLFSAIPFWQDYKARKYKNGSELEKAANTVVKAAFLELEEAPLRASDRKFQYGAARMAQSVLGRKGINVSLADIQAALWYYEKRLYAMLGGKKAEDIGYEEAIVKHANDDRPAGRSTRFSGEVGSGAESAGESGTAVSNVQQAEPAAEPAAGTEQQEVNTVGQYSRALVADAVDGKPSAPDLFVINSNPAVLTAVGAPQEPLVIGKRTVMKVANPESVGKSTENFSAQNSAGFMVQRMKRIALSVDELRAVPTMIGNPVAVIKVNADPRLNRRESYKVVLDLVKEGNPVIAIVQPGVLQRGPRAVRASEIASIYPVNQESSLRETNSEIGGGQLLYFNKGKATVLASKIGKKLPSLVSAATGLKAKKPGDVSTLKYDIHPSSNFSRNMADDMAAQEVFLMERAKAAGYEDVDAWIDADYDGFVKAAAEWRNDHPVEGAFARGLQGNRFNLPERTRTERMSNLFANEMSRVTAVQQAVQEQGGVVSEETNIENSLHRMYGRAGNRIEEFRKKVVKPIIDAAAKMNVNMNDVALYMYANHAIERNSHIKSINPGQFPDGGSGMTNQAASDTLRDLRSRGAEFAKIKNVADQLQRITQSTGKVLLDGGLVDQATLNNWDNNFKYYVPLKNFEQISEETGKSTGNSGFDPRKDFFKRAMGRESLAGQIVEQLLMDHENAIVAAEKNKLRQAFLKFVLQNPDPKLWEVDPMVLQRSYNKNLGLVGHSLVVDDAASRTIGVRVNGVPRSIRVNDKAMLDDLQMMPILRGPGAQFMFKYWGGINRALSKFWTALSPYFTYKNATRDLEFALAKSGVESGSKQMKAVLTDFIPLAYTIMRAERDGNWGQNSTDKAYYEMYKDDGGKTGYLDYQTLEDRQQNVISDFRNAQASTSDPRTYHRLALRAIRSAEDLILDINGGIENATRVAVYKSVIESAGYDHTNAPKDVREKAATAAKNITVNFNRRGKLTPLMSSTYLFFNAGVQGALNTAKFVMSKRGAYLASSLVALGYVIAAYSSGATGDDDEPYWKKEANRNKKLRNMLFFKPNGDSVEVPLAYGLGFFVNLGYAMHDLKNGEPVGKVGKFMFDSAMLHFSPLGSFDNVASFFSPTAIDPFIVMSGERREDGTPLLPPDFDNTKPDSERYFTQTRGTVLQLFTDWLNEATGGSHSEPGAISVSPEKLKYGITYATGGAGTFVKDLFVATDLALNVGRDAVYEKNAIPFFNQVYKVNNGKMDQAAFYENSIEVKRAKNELKELDSDNPSAGALKRADINESYAAIETLSRSATKQLARLRKDEIAIIDDKDMSRRDKYDQLKAIDDQRRQIYTDFNTEFYGTRRDVGRR